MAREGASSLDFEFRSGVRWRLNGVASPLRTGCFELIVLTLKVASMVIQSSTKRGDNIDFH
jgi:hypothetical protein